MEFLNSSLDKLVGLLHQKNHSFPLIQQHSKYSPNNMDLMISKGIYPYSWVKSIQQLENQKHLPEKKDFYNDLKEEDTAPKPPGNKPRISAVRNECESWQSNSPPCQPV